MDYQRFLAKPTPEEVLPYFGGPFVEAGNRRLRLDLPSGHEVAPGFWLFRVYGRRARPVEVAQAPGLDHLPVVRGYALAGYLVGDRGRAERFALAPEDELLPFTPVIGRRWPSGELLFERTDFETGAEEEVRAAYESRQPLRGLRGVPAALRAAFAYAILLRASQETGVPVRPAEVLTRVAELTDEGDVAARRILGSLAAARAAEAARVSSPEPEWVRARDEALARRRHGGLTITEAQRAEERAAAALRAAGGALRGIRWLADGLLEVRYDFRGDRFASIVDARTLNVTDAGICLAGDDSRLTLQSLPSAIDEAQRTGQLHITAW